MDKFRNESGNPRLNAQRNLEGRTHYVDEKTMRYFRSRILKTSISADGLLFGMVESVSLNPDHTQRGFRAVVFDVFGTVIHRASLDECHKTRTPAEKDLRRIFDATDAVAHTLEAVESKKRMYAREMDEFALSLTAQSIAA